MNLPEGFDPSLLLLIVPLVLLELGLIIYAVYDLLKQDRHVRGGSKAMWAIIILFLNGIGPLVYLLIGRVDAPVDEPRWPGQPGWGSPHDPPVAGSAQATVPAPVAGSAQATVPRPTPHLRWPTPSWPVSSRPASSWPMQPCRWRPMVRRPSASMT